MPEGQDLRRLLDDVARLSETVEQLLDFEQQEQATDHKETVDLLDLTRNVVAERAPPAIAADYEISFKSAVKTLERHANPTALPRAVSNLVRNAINHSGNSGMTSVSVAAKGRITVADQGKGIPPDQQALVFEPFYRIVPRSRGAGLGLSLVRQIVTNQHGRVTIESGPIETVFTLHL